MEWKPIERDENGLATDKCLDEMAEQMPVALYNNDPDPLFNGYWIIARDAEDKEIIRCNSCFVAYLPLPKYIEK